MIQLDADAALACWTEAAAESAPLVDANEPAVLDDVDVLDAHGRSLRLGQQLGAELHTAREDVGRSLWSRLLVPDRSVRST